MTDGPARLHLLVVNGRSAGAGLVLDDTAFDIGRSPECRLRVDDEGVSRRHCRVERSAAGWSLSDNSTSGTFVNGKRIAAHLLVDGDRIQIGASAMIKVVAHQWAPHTGTKD